MATGDALRDWVDTIRRARLSRTTKLVAFALSGWASPDGTDVHPGIAQLAHSCGITYNVVQTALADLRATGFIQLVARPSGRHSADEYRLVILPDAAKPIEIWTKERMIQECEAMYAGRRGRHRERPTAVGRAKVPDPTAWGLDAPHAVGSGGDSTPHGVGSQNSALIEPRPHGVVGRDPTPLPPTFQDLPTKNKEQVVERGTNLTVPRSPEPSGLAKILRHPSAELAIITDTRLPVVTTQTILADWINFCQKATPSVILTKHVIGGYAKVIKDMLDEGFGETKIKNGLALMLTKGQAGFPRSLSTYIVQAQVQPNGAPPRRLTPGEESAQRLIAGADNPGVVIDAIQRFFDKGVS